MKNSVLGLRTAHATALVAPLAVTLLGLSPHLGAAQGTSAARNENAPKTSGQVVQAATGATVPHRAAPATTETDLNITAAQEQLRRVTVGYQNGANSRAEVSNATIALAEARVHSATARDKFTGLGPDLETVVTHRQQLLDEARTRYQVGAGGRSDVTKAEEALAEARVRVDLYGVLTSRQSALSEVNVRYKSGAASTQETEKAAAALQKAERAFNESGDD